MRLPVEPPRTRREQLAALEEIRDKSARPTLPLTGYAGSYESSLYGKLVLSEKGDNLEACFGEFRAKLSHWHGDELYGHAVVEPFFDWLVKFQIADGRACALEIVHIGWKEPDERFLFRRADDR